VASHLSADDIAFLDGLVTPPEPKHLDELPKDDQFFLGGIVKRLHARQLDVPVFPKAAVRLAGMLRESDVPVSRYVALLNEDPALSVEVLKVANSAFYGAARKTTTLDDAIMRIGLTRLQSILLMAHVKARVMKGGVLQHQAALLLDMALPMAFLASRFVLQSERAGDVRFMRGMLMHVEHLVILGAITDISKEHRAQVVPSVHAVLQAFNRFGAEIRAAVAAAWDLKDILIDSQLEDSVAGEYAGLRAALICRWLRRPLPQLDGVDPNQLAAAMADVLPRVPPESEALSA
jgi:HD-like signal output (HDOD) protein